MNDLVKYLVEQFLTEETKNIIVLLPGGFKPPHGGHLDLAKRYAALPNVAQVRILIGPKEREGFTRDQSVAIWNQLLMGTPNIVVEKVQEDNPLLAAYKYIELKAKPGIYALAASSKGGDYDRVKNFVASHEPGQKYYKKGVKVVELPLNVKPMLYRGRTDKENGKGVSASTLRKDIATDNFQNFATNYPNITDKTTLTSIFNKLKGKLAEVVYQKSKLRVFDFDDTLIKTDHKVYVTKGDGTKLTLTPGQYAKYTPAADDQFDFSEFEGPISNGKVIKKTLKILQDILKAPGSDRKAAILTARGNAKPVRDFLRGLGIDMPIIALRSSDPFAKKAWIKSQIEKGFTDIYFTDDSEKNIKAVDTLKSEYPNIKLRTQLVHPEEGTIEEMLLEGGGAGHLAHPYEDLNLTFEDIKNMIESTLSGEVDYAQEKLDGQNLMVSYKDGKVVAARNKGQIKNFGQNALSTTQVEQMFANRGPIQAAFTEAMEDLTTAIDKLTTKQKKYFFDNGRKFLNLEVLYPETANVIPYGATVLKLHNIRAYDQAGNVTGEDQESARALAGAIKQIQADKQKTYKIGATDQINIAKSADYTNQRKELLNMLSGVYKKYNLKLTDKLGAYLQSWWSDYIDAKAKGYNYKLDPNTKQQLINRWAFSNKDVNIKEIKKGITDPNFLNWITNFDKTEVPKVQKTALKPVETLFLKLGVYVLKNVENLVALNPNVGIRKMKQELAQAIKQIKAAAATEDPSDDAQSLNFLKRELGRLKDIGGFEAIVPTEGIVFKYNDKLYKLTGAFAPINQILGYLKF